jgi:hypothetical protein
LQRGVSQDQAGALRLGLALAIVTQWLAKSVYEAAVTPLTYGVVTFLKRQEELDVYDYETRFNPLLLTG